MEIREIKLKLKDLEEKLNTIGRALCHRFQIARNNNY